MKKKLIIGKTIGISMLTLVMVGCGGGGGSSNTAPPPPTSVPGGTPSAPAVISLDMNNDISTDDFYNYFQYTGQEGEKLVIHATLNNELTRKDMGRCSMSTGYEGSTHIAVYDINMNWEDEYYVCGTDITLTYPTDTTYIIQTRYSSIFSGQNSGYFNATSIKP